MSVLLFFTVKFLNAIEKAIIAYEYKYYYIILSKMRILKL